MESNSFWQNQTKYDSFELRQHRFRDEMLPIFYHYLGITPDSKVLDGGCGTGVFTRYLGRNLDGGTITGFDISKAFIEYGKDKLAKLNLDDKVCLEVADGANLYYSDDTFDTVTNYAYIGVLSEPVCGLRELIRVCKPGGVVSCVVATNMIQSVAWQGDYPFDGADELQTLVDTENSIFSRIANNNEKQTLTSWHSLRYPKLLSECGLTNIHLYPFGHAICYNDTDFDMDYRKKLLIDETLDDMQWKKSRYDQNKNIYREYRFTNQHMARMIELLEVKLEYIKDHFESDTSFEWQGSLNFIITGVKPDNWS